MVAPTTQKKKNIQFNTYLIKKKKKTCFLDSLINMLLLITVHLEMLFSLLFLRFFTCSTASDMIPLFSKRCV